jgi:DNA-directed RNA polymerase specialized sigma24 family protein
MQGLSAEDPADLVVAWEAVEELLAAVPEGCAKDVLRMVAAGLPADDIAERLDLAVPDVEALVARGRIRVPHGRGLVTRRRGSPPRLIRR